MSNRKPMVLVFAGPNGSGKSTIKQFFEIVGTYTNADDIVSATGMTNEGVPDLLMKSDTNLLIQNRILHLRQFFHQTTSWISL